MTQWFEEAKKLAPIALKASIAWGNPDGRVILTPLGEKETLESSMADAGFLAAKFVPIQTLVLIPDEVKHSLEIKVIPIPPLGSEARILAASLMPAAVQAFVLEAKREGIAGEDEIQN